MPGITPCLWFDGNAEDAANFYRTVFPDVAIDRVVRAPSDNPSMAEGAVLVVEFAIAGQALVGLNGGPQFPFTEAISFQIDCDGQAEVNRYYDALSAVPEAEQCGWVKDKFGLSWQIVPRTLMRLLADPDPDRARRASLAMMEMKRLDIAALERAAEGQS